MRHGDKNKYKLFQSLVRRPSLSLAYFIPPLPYAITLAVPFSWERGSRRRFVEMGRLSQAASTDARGGAGERP